MRVHHIRRDNDHDETFELLDDDGQAIPVVAGFLRQLRARGCSPNTLSAYAYDLLHFMTFLKEQQLTYLDFSPRHAFLFLEYLSMLPSRKRAQRLSLVLSTTTDEGTSATRLSPESSRAARIPFNRSMIRLWPGLLNVTVLSWGAQVVSAPSDDRFTSKRFGVFLVRWMTSRSASCWPRSRSNETKPCFC